MKRSILSLGIIVLFILSAISPIVISNNIKTSNEIVSESTGDGGLMDSSWPMHAHDIFHTGRSPYNTINNQGHEKWLFDTERKVDGSAVIDDTGTIFIGADKYFYAINPNGSQKWKTTLSWGICEFGTSPAIDESGIIYVPTHHDGLFAVNINGTIEWNYGGEIDTSPVIGDDGTIYFGDIDHNIKALNPNGTLKWKYATGHQILSSPAIGLDGTIYCGSIDKYVYALYPNNGTLKWKFNTGGWVHGSPSIGQDGTIYIGSDDKYLYALYPNGTMKWNINVGSMRCSPSIDKDGILYFGVWEEKFYAVYPNGTIKWIFNLGKNNGIWGSTAAISDDGIIFFGTCIDIGMLGGGDVIALNSDGTEKWRVRIATDVVTSSPCIGEDGTIYIGSNNDLFHPGSKGYLHAINALDPNAPIPPEIEGPKKLKKDIEYEYNFSSTSPIGNDLYYWINWGDNEGTGWIGPYPSGKKINSSHKWLMEQTYTIKARVKDIDNLWSSWSEFKIEVKNSRNKVKYNSLLLKFLEKYSFIENPLNL